MVWFFPGLSLCGFGCGLVRPLFMENNTELNVWLCTQSRMVRIVCIQRIKDTTSQFHSKIVKSLNKGHNRKNLPIKDTVWGPKCSLLYIFNLQKEDNSLTKDKMADPTVSFFQKNNEFSLTSNQQEQPIKLLSYQRWENDVCVYPVYVWTGSCHAGSESGNWSNCYCRGSAGYVNIKLYS